MIEHADETRTPAIDASVHIFFPSNKDLRAFLREPFKSRGFPDDEMDWYGAPGGEYAPNTESRTASIRPRIRTSGANELFSKRGVDVAVLHPMGRGIMPDRHLGSALHAAHNEMMVSRWLESGEFGDRFRGTIRVNPDDIAGAVREIEQWRAHPRVVQIGVPMQSRELYGKPQFWPLWEAAADANLPVACTSRPARGSACPRRRPGHPTYEQYVSFMALNYLYHLMNMIAEGVFERLPGLKFVWADGAADLLTPFIWRMDTFGRPHLEQTPWAPRIPERLPARTCVLRPGQPGRPGDTEFAGEWLGFTGKEDMVMFGSSYPHWQCGDITKLPQALSAEATREGVLAQRGQPVRDRHFCRPGSGLVAE